MTFFRKIFAALILCVLSASVLANEGSKIRLWVAWAPGGPVDIQARMIQKHLLATDPSATVIVEYHPGSNGGLGLAKFMRHNEPGEYVNLFVDTPNILISKYITKTNKLDIEQDIRIGTVIGVEPMLIVTSKQSGILSIQDLRNSTKPILNYGSSGLGSASHLTTAFLEASLKKTYNHVPYKGSAPVFTDLINGNLDLFSVFFSLGSAQALDQRVNAIAVTGKRRSALLPNVPTLEEQGVRNFPISAWTAVFVNPNDNQQSQQRAIAAVNKVLAMPAVQEEFAGRGIAVDTEHKKDPNSWWQGEIRKYQNLATLPQFRDLASKD